MSRWRRDQAGAATALAAGFAGLLVLVGWAGAIGVAAIAQHRRAEAAADLTALAAAQALQAGGNACAVADRIADANGADLDSCRVEGAETVVAVHVPGPPPFTEVPLRARARAGPAP